MNDRRLNPVTIVGMRFYPGSHEYIRKASHEPELSQHLYLVVEPTNNHDIHAVMLHNGKKKLASVTKEQSADIKQMLLKPTEGSKGEDVFVCRIDKITTPLNDFQYIAVLQVRILKRVNERLARKYADFSLKE